MSPEPGVLGRLAASVADGTPVDWSHIEPDIERFQPGTSYAQAPLLLRSLDGGAFTDVSSIAGADFTKARVGRGLAVGG